MFCGTNLLIPNGIEVPYLDCGETLVTHTFFFSLSSLDTSIVDFHLNKSRRSINYRELFFHFRRFVA